MKYRFLFLFLLVVAGCDGSDDPAEETVPLNQADSELADGDLEAALQSYEGRLAADPNDDQAGFGAALTRLMLLPTSAPVDDLLMDCGEAPISLDFVFGEQGLLDWAEESRDGTVDLRVTTEDGTDALMPTSVFSSLTTSDFDGAETVDVTVQSLFDATGGSEVFRVRANDADFSDGVVVTAGGEFSVGLGVTLETVSSNGDSRFLSGDSIRSGSISIRVSGGTLRVEFEDVEFNTFSGTFNVDGTIEDTVDGPYEISTEDLNGSSFDDVEVNTFGEFVQELGARCSAPLDDAFVLSFLDDFAGELAAIRQRLDGIDDANFSFDIPASTFANPAAVRVGLETVLGLRAALLTQEAIIEAVGQFSYFRQGVETMLDSSGEVDVNQAAAELNASFLTSESPVSFEPMITDELQAAIAEAQRALDVSSDGVVNLAELPASAKAEIRQGLDTVSSALEDPTNLPRTPEYTLNPGDVMADPPNRDSMRAEAGGDVWTVNEFGELEFSSAVVDWLADRLSNIESLDGQVTTLSCMSDSECQAADPTLECGGFTFPGVCAGGGSQTCDTDTDCGGDICVFDVCSARGPQLMDLEVFEGLVDNRRVPDFVNGSSVFQVGEAY
ncbi:MAG: hypothetical protein AAFX94_07380, partial [Myxococcota bacterium]